MVHFELIELQAQTSWRHVMVHFGLIGASGNWQLLESIKAAVDRVRGRLWEDVYSVSLLYGNNILGNYVADY